MEGPLLFSSLDTGGSRWCPRYLTPRTVSWGGGPVRQLTPCFGGRRKGRVARKQLGRPGTAAVQNGLARPSAEGGGAADVDGSFSREGYLDPSHNWILQM